MTIEQANLLDKYLTFKCNSNGNTGYYINVMNNDEESSLRINQIDSDLLNRKHHNCCNITVIGYSEFDNSYKDFFSDRNYYYVIFNRSTTNSVDIRKDLIDVWARNNAKDRVIIVNTQNNSVWDYSMQDFYGKSPLSFKYRWNKDGNLTRYFTLSTPAFKDKSPETVDNQGTVNYIMKSWAYLGHVVYATHRRSKKMVMIAQYDSNGNRKNYHVMKSLPQVYDFLDFSNVGCLRTFQRLFETSAVVSLFLTNKKGITYWISTESHLVPPEKVTDKSGDGVIKETVIGTDPDTLETSVNHITSVELDLRGGRNISAGRVASQIVKMQQLETCKQNANERLLKKSGKPLSQEQANLVDSLILCNYTKKPLVSFYEDKIKVQLDVGKNRYMLDYSVNDFDGTVLVGTYKNSEYKVEQVSVSKLPEIIRG